MADWKAQLDRLSFSLGMTAAFCECVAAECKKCALSAPIRAEEYESQREKIEAIIGEHGLSFYYEPSADLPEVQRLSFWVIYKYEDTLEEYLALRARGYHPVTDLTPFRDVLSYGIAYRKE